MTEVRAEGDQRSLSPRQLFDVASKWAHKGVNQGGGSSYYRTFVGSYTQGEEKHRISIELHTSPGYDWISIRGGEQINASIHNNMGDSHATVDERYTLSGKIPGNILEMLSSLEPDKTAMAELDKIYREGMISSAKVRREAERKLGDPRMPFWKAEEILKTMSPGDADNYVRHDHGRLLPFWIRDKFQRGKKD